jgi:cation:H+ antiporter
MSLPIAIIYLVLGLVILWKAADVLVSGAVNLANRLGISPLVIGLTIVAMGTSAPEVAASIAASLRNTGDVALGNVYGSNVANLALVGGLCAVIRPISVNLGILKREIPVMLIVALLLFPILHNLELSRPEGIILLVVFFSMISYIIIEAKRQGRNHPHTQQQLKDEIETVKKIKTKPLWLSIVMVIGGLAGLAIGADITLRGAVEIGRRAGLSDAVIGLTIVAVGTSLPELATCLVAAFKKQDDISIGNLVGSNIFNTLLVTGTAGSVRPFSIEQRLAQGDYFIMVGVSVVFMVMALIGKRISRINGIILTAIYVGFLVYSLTFSG